MLRLSAAYLLVACSLLGKGKCAAVVRRISACCVSLSKLPLFDKEKCAAVVRSIIIGAYPLVACSLLGEGSVLRL